MSQKRWSDKAPLLLFKVTQTVWAPCWLEEKLNDRLRVRLGLKELNKAINREYHPGKHWMA